MSKVLVNNSSLIGIGSAIRSKNGSNTTYKPSEMAAAINAIDTGGITPTGSIAITQNGTVDVTQYASAAVNVPNSYAASDEGKVVSNGALVAQTARASEITQNGTYNTTENNSITVNVSGGGGIVNLAELVAWEQGALGSEKLQTSYSDSKVDSTTRLRTATPVSLMVGSTYKLTCNPGFEIVIQGYTLNSIGWSTGYGDRWEAYTGITFVAATSLCGIAVRKSDQSTIVVSDLSNANAKLVKQSA